MLILHKSKFNSRNRAVDKDRTHITDINMYSNMPFMNFPFLPLAKKNPAIHVQALNLE